MNMANIQRGRCVICNELLADKRQITCLSCHKPCEIDKSNFPQNVPENQPVVFDAKSACCGSDVDLGAHATTCGTECHELLVGEYEQMWGTYKKIIDASTNIAYKVPTRVLIESGIRAEELPNFPRWDSVS